VLDLGSGSGSPVARCPEEEVDPRVSMGAGCLEQAAMEETQAKRLRRRRMEHK
jgi:hypothetical protein